MLPIPQEIRSVLLRLQDAGYRPYLVGGCVRDLMRGCAPADYDLTSDARPEEVMALFGAAAHPTGLPHGTVTVAENGRAVEITTMRRDGAYRDNRHPEQVTFTDSIEEDLARRDFTVNAMALAPDGTRIDPFGGEEDLRRGLLRCVGAARERFTEDALRMLRLLRFSSVLGFLPEADTAAAAHEKRELLQTVAAERVYAEVSRMLCGQDVCRVLLEFPDVLGVALPEILRCVGFEQRNHHHAFTVWEHTARSVAAVPPEAVLRWTMLLHDVGKPECFTLGEDGEGHFHGHTARSAELAGDVFRRLHFDRATEDGVRRLLACFEIPLAPERSAIHRAMAQWGKETVGQLLKTRYADQAAKAPDGAPAAHALCEPYERIYAELMAENACCSVRELAVNGQDMQRIGFTGRAIGRVLLRLLDETAAEKLPNERERLYARAERLYGSNYENCRGRRDGT